MSAKTEVIRDSHVDRHLAGLVRHVVEVTIRVRILEIQRRRHDAMTDSKGTDGGFDATSGAQQVTRHGLGRGNGNLGGLFAKDALDGERLATVVNRGRGAVGVDVAHFGLIDTSLGQGTV